MVGPPASTSWLTTYGSIQPSTDPLWSTTSTHITSSNPMLHGRTLRSMTPSDPGNWAATWAMVRFGGEIISPNPPPELLAPASSSGNNPVRPAAVTWRAPNRALADVSEPDTATPNHPRTGERKARAA